MALNITVQSYDQHLDFGLMADARAMPDVRRVADGLAQALDTLRVMKADPDDDAEVSPARQRRR
jgi:hypothetical protein